jgi:hypothetical protein
MATKTRKPSVKAKTHPAVKRKVATRRPLPTPAPLDAPQSLAATTAIASPVVGGPAIQPRPRGSIPSGAPKRKAKKRAVKR